MHKFQKGMGRILAMDYGEKRTGIAVTDDLKLIASGLTTVHTPELLDFLENYLKSENVELFLIGEPRKMDATASESERFIGPFLKKLRSRFPEVPVARIDERFTSKMAVQSMIEGGMKKKKRQNKALIDEISATLILQSYLCSKKDE